MPDNVLLTVVGATIVDYRNFAVCGRGRIPKVEGDRDRELPIDQSASILIEPEGTGS